MMIIPYCYKAGDEAFAASMKETYFTWFDSHNLRRSDGWEAWVIRDGAGIVAWGHLEPFDSGRKAHVARVGVCVREDKRSNGLATRMVSHVCAIAQQRGYTKLWATYHLPNVAAGKAFFDNAFEREAVFEREERWDGKFVDVVSVARFLHG